MKAVIFLGPSLRVADARRIFPDAVYLPPARQSDIVSALTIHRPDVIGLVDGEFGQSLSVWHKEILYALHRGVPVYGSSSMGALRAAETSAFGMVGVGRVYELFASGALNDDDEVALAHGEAESEYRGLSDPMVNLRLNLIDARDAGIIDDAALERFTALAKEIFFPMRSRGAMLEAARVAGESPETIERLRRHLREHWVDVKRQDAIQLVETLRDLPTPVPAPPPFAFEWSHLFETLYQRDRCVRHNGVDVPLAAIADHAALHLPDFAALNTHALNRALVCVLADMLEVTVTDAQIDDELKRFRLSRKLTTPADLERWLAKNDLEPDELRATMRDAALGRALHRWLVIRKFMERTTKLVLDELRLAGRYEEMAAAAASHEAILSDNFHYFKQTNFDDLPTEQLVIDHLRSTPCRMDTAYNVWAEEAGFHGVTSLRVSLLRSRVVREYLADIAHDARLAVTPALTPTLGVGAAPANASAMATTA